MMLAELYQYALDKSLVARPGFRPKKIKAYVSLSADGQFIAIDPGPEEKVLCPDLGALANGTTKCNILVEKATYPLTEEKPGKHVFYLDALLSGSEVEPMFTVVLRALETPETVKAITEALESNKFKMSEVIGFKVDGKPVEKSPRYLKWWDAFRAAQTPVQTAEEKRCMITGKLAKPLLTVPKVSGLRTVGGHSAGDALLCFDKSAFCSYDLEQGQNASVSEEAMTAVNAALNELIAQAPKLAGAKWIHWYQKPLRPEEDLLALIMPMMGMGEAEEEQQEEQANDDQEVDVQLALKAADRLVESAKNGENPDRLQNRYYLLSLSGASGRMMVRNWSQGRYQELYSSMKSWFDDLRLVLPNGKGLCKSPKLFALNMRLLKVMKGAGNLGKRMADELAGLEPQIIQSIVNNAPLPDSVAARALQFIRSKMLDSVDDEVYPDPLACQWLKIWLLRKQRGGIKTVEERLYQESSSGAYHLGRMMAVYADIQAKAMGPNLGTGVIQRYYASACTSPALVIGQLSRMSQHHLAKIDSNYIKDWYHSMLGEISGKIGSNIPTTLSLEQQSEFALGYYQQRAAMIVERVAAKKAKNSDSKEE